MRSRLEKEIKQNESETTRGEKREKFIMNYFQISFQIELKSGRELRNRFVQLLFFKFMQNECLC